MICNRKVFALDCCNNKERCRCVAGNHGLFYLSEPELQTQMVKSVQLTISTKQTAIEDSKDLKPREVERDQGLVLS